MKHHRIPSAPSSSRTEDSRRLRVVSMDEAVGYPRVDCSQESAIEDAIVLKHDRLFLLTNSHGQVTPPGRCGLGLFHDDTRILSYYLLRFAGEAPALLSAQIPRMYTAQLDMAVNDLQFGGDRWDPKHCVHLRREILLDDRMRERLSLSNYLTSSIDYWVELKLACDFADIFEVRGWSRPERGQFYAPRCSDRSLEFAYRGRDGALMHSRLLFAEPPDSLNAQGARWEFPLQPNQMVSFEWEILPDGIEPSLGDGPGRNGSRAPTAPLRATRRASGQGKNEAVAGGPHAARETREESGLESGSGADSVLETRYAPLEELYENWRSHCSRLQTDVAEFNATLDHAVDDLYSLYIPADGESIISAGIPWYSTVFGRDAIVTGLQTLILNPRIALDALRYLAHHQGQREDAFTEEQPGKILHELRRGEMARAHEIPQIPYYGSVDATPLWLILLHEVWRWTGNDSLVQELLPNAERALRWIDEYGDMDGDGFVEYARTSERGLVNQGWKDSGDGVPFPDGTLPRGPIALVEVQGYVYDARMRMAAVLESYGRKEEAEEQRKRAGALRERIIERFWMQELNTFALALDGEKQPIRTVTSNAGHLLWSRVPTIEQAHKLKETLLGADMFSGWGIRTLSSVHPVYNPMSYHNGSVWPHDNALIILGLALYSQCRAASPVIEGLQEAARHMKGRRLPELFCGIRRTHGMTPVLYPVSCSPQAWASGAFFMLLQAATGILPDAPANVLHIREPGLPDFLRELEISNLPVGGSRVSLLFRRDRQRTLVDLLGVDGDPLQVRIELS